MAVSSGYCVMSSCNGYWCYSFYVVCSVIIGVAVVGLESRSCVY